MKKIASIVAVVLLFMFFAVNGSGGTTTKMGLLQSIGSNIPVLSSLIGDTASKVGNVTQTNGSTDKNAVTLVKVVDGDTLKVNYQGQEKTIRLLLMDTPESVKPGTPVQPFAKEASERMKQLVWNKALTIEFDVGERNDKYGRLLAYVYADGVMLQKTLIQEGLARVAYVYPPNTRYLSELEKAQAEAKSERKKIWSRAGYVTSKGFQS
ncbi:thermonuclease family protein [Listeria booriae]|uniref:Thermonuclease family protein n=1 Tax=Listeria booriae TaxID=1552123 RepID=A0A841YAF0_9LIST|nr:thermonuclease family protein [Listeria booriae]MBC1373810.1 thermonuclease family protein [Listeria booriae]